MARWTWLIACALWLASESVAQAAPAPRVALYTMGPGDEVFSLFGHAALCVFDARHPAGRCYNYGTTDFTRPVELTRDFLRGTAEFWVSVSPEPVMVGAYRRADRTVYRQDLPLSDAQARRLSRALERDLRPECRSYVYHHFRDNCSTRLRDVINDATEGALRAPATEQRTLRDAVRERLAGHTGLLLLSELVLGRGVDTPASGWEAMFLPVVLRQRVASQLAAKPRIVEARDNPLPSGRPRHGAMVIAWVGSLFGIACAMLFAAPQRRVARLGLIAAGLVFGGAGLALAALACATEVPELRENELLLVITPLDLMLVSLRGAWLLWFVRLRLAGLAVVVLGAATGVLIQPLLAPVAALVVFFGSIALTLHRRRLPT